MTTRTVQEIRVSEVRELLKAGVTRFRSDDEGFGSIEEKYNLSPAAVRRLFQNEYLKGLKTIVPEFVLVVDVDDAPSPEDVEETPEEVHEAEVLARSTFAETVAEIPPMPASAPYGTVMTPEDASALFAKLSEESEGDVIAYGKLVDDAIMDPKEKKEDSLEDLFK